MSKSKTKYDLLVPPEFEWPEYNSDSERIKAYSKRFENMSIAESFAAVYGAEIDKNIINSEEYKAAEYCNTHPINIGDIIEVTVESISKRDTLVSYHNSKQNFVLKQNIASWNIRPGDKIRVSVVEKVRDNYVVDCVEPLYKDWINRVSSTLANAFQSFEVRVTDLVMQKGGYTGKIAIPEISKLTGKPYLIDAFIPGSQIELNICEDFTKWDGTAVDAMVTNFTQKDGKLSAACSRKKLLNSAGCTSLVNIFDAGYGRGTRFTQITFDGTVLGVLNSSKKHGVFVEIPEYNITGLIEKDPRELVKYHKGDSIKVQIDKFDWDSKKQPYRRNRDGIITEVNIKPIFVEV